MAKSPEEMAASMIAALKEKTGKTLPEWKKIVAKWEEKKHGQIVKRLKSEHGVTHGYANLIAHETLGSAASAQPSDDLIAGQYSGKKADLRPIYEKLIKEIRKFGKDVEIAPKKSYVSLRRSKQFGLIQPSTATRIDVGINLPGKAPTDRLEASGSFNAMVSHRVRIATEKDIDKELLGWIKEAYEGA
ncbi:DUF4287 domain-containing protein [bacterium]|nr:DUF4287 domain-containing protein [bacterium]